MKKKLLSIVQLLLGIGLIVFIFARMDNKSDMLEALRAGARHWPMLVLGVGGFFFCLLPCHRSRHIGFINIGLNGYHPIVVDSHNISDSPGIID